MITVGIDIVSVKRVSFLIEKYGNRFLERVFSKVECDYCSARKDPHICFAGKFAAKEAVIKAMALKNVSLKNIEILNSEGTPFVRVNGKIVRGSSISVSHERDFAIAVCAFVKEV
uniref:Holo-[acyl-carrier-protein] synthase n=1 Tax=candidate division WOR-3 bacterium TaxID=2052148 RepID=A0A7C2P7R8_UNCW3